VGGTKATSNGGDGGMGTTTNIISTTTAVSLGVGQVIGSNLWFAGGGAGAGAATSGAGGAGGGANGNPNVANSGKALTGGGGAGGNAGGVGAGGKGIVIISYPSVYKSPTVTGTTITPVVSGNNTVYVFTSSGYISF
jgi:hypothetical protein